jgi:hypothetical protein
LGGPPPSGLRLIAGVPGRPRAQRLIAAITVGDQRTVERFLAEYPELARARIATGATRAAAKDHWLDEISHYVYAGDTALHVAAAAHATNTVGALVAAGAEVGAVNRRGAQPLHYAVDGGPDGPRWDPVAQTATVGWLLDAGADPNAADKGGTTPLHRAIRNRCAPAAEVLLARGADAKLPNGRGSSAWQLANWTTGKGGSGSAAAKAQQAQILRLLEAHGARDP